MERCSTHFVTDLDELELDFRELLLLRAVKSIVLEVARRQEM